MSSQPTATPPATASTGDSPNVSNDPTSSWWRRAAVYQVYPRSFADANGDGTGDVNGIRSRLPYLADLGVDAIWISPWYPSPLNDGGYDVRDYRDIDPRFGTLADAEALLTEAHQQGLRIIVDLVPNHTSSEHVWFQAALAAGPGSAERDRYIFRDGRGDGSEPPNNWVSVFGGSAWTRVDDGQWYLHLFDPTQPDLNWNNPEVREEFDSIFRFWLDRGVDGFRVDVAHSLAKKDGLPDLTAEQIDPVLTGPVATDHPHWDRPEVHEIIRRWRTILDDYQAEHDREVMMVAEAWVPPASLPNYLRPDEYHQSFNFDFLTLEWDAEAFRHTADQSIDAAAEVGSTPTWTLSNHDVMRHATRYGLPHGTHWRTWPLTGPHGDLDAELGLRRARAAALVMLALPGSVYIYQGEELGLPDVWDLPEDVLDDPVWENSGHEQKGRDGCRVPIPWASDGLSFGFGDANPWLPQPARYGELSVEVQQGIDGSTLELYRSLLTLRRELLTGDERIEWRDDLCSPTTLGFSRSGGFTCLVNFGDGAIDVPDGEILAASDEIVDRRLPGNAGIWIRSAG